MLLAMADELGNEQRRVARDTNSPLPAVGGVNGASASRQKDWNIIQTNSLGKYICFAMRCAIQYDTS
jgi:hypothetical protein